MSIDGIQHKGCIDSLKWLLVLVLLVYSGLANAQNSNGRELFEKAEAFLQANAFDSACHTAKKAALYFQKHGDTQGYFKASMLNLEALHISESYGTLESESLALLKQTKTQQGITTPMLARLNFFVSRSLYLMHFHIPPAMEYYQKSMALLDPEQGVPDFLLAELWVHAAAMYRNSGQFERAAGLRAKALSLCEEHYPEKHWMIAQIKLTGIMNQAYADAEMVRGLKALLPSLESDKDYRSLLQSIAICGFLGEAYGRGIHLDSAAMMYAQQQKLLDQLVEPSLRDLGQLYWNLSLLNKDKGSYEAAKDYLNKGIDIYSQLFGAESVRTADFYGYLGELLLQLDGPTREVKSYLDRNYEAFSAHFKNPNAHRMAQPLSRLAEFYTLQGEDLKALNYLSKVVEVHKASKNPVGEAETYLNMAISKLNLAETDQALRLLKESLGLMKPLYPNGYKSIAGVYLQYGRAYTLLEDWDQANFWLSQSVAMNTDLFSPQHPEVARSLLQISELKSQQQQKDSALIYIDRAIMANQREHEPIDELLMLDLKFSKAKLLENALSPEASAAELRSLEALYDACFDLINGLVKTRVLEKDVSALVTTHMQVFDAGLANLYRLWQQTNDADIKLKILRLSESSRATTLRLGQQRQHISRYAGIPSELVQKEKDQVQEMAILNNRILRDQSLSSADKEVLATKVFNLQREHSALLESFRKEYPDYHRLRYVRPDLTEKNLKRIPKDETYVEYYQNANQLYAMVLNQQGLHLRMISEVDSLDTWINRFNTAINPWEPKVLQATGRALYHLLIQPIADLISSEKLTVAPHGDIWKLNFDLLLDQSDKLLIESHAISYAYSLAHLLQEHPQKPNDQRMLALAYAPEGSDQLEITAMRGPQLGSIPGTANEIASLAELFEGTYYYGEAANEGTFKRLANNSWILHLALHGEVDYENSDQSRLFFQPTKQDSLEDGYLYPEELYAMDLRAELAVLSGCATGTGQVQQGEGIMSLGRAFRYAGVNSLMLSHWEVSDAVAPEIITAFYQYLKAGKHKAVALRLAKLDYLERADNLASNPFYWSSYFILGDASPLNSADSSQYWWLILIGVLGLTGIGYWRYKRLSRS